MLNITLSLLLLQCLHTTISLSPARAVSRVCVLSVPIVQCFLSLPAFNIKFDAFLCVKLSYYCPACSAQAHLLLDRSPKKNIIISWKIIRLLFIKSSNVRCVSHSASMSAGRVWFWPGQDWGQVGHHEGTERVIVHVAIRTGFIILNTRDDDLILATIVIFWSLLCQPVQNNNNTCTR